MAIESHAHTPFQYGVWLRGEAESGDQADGEVPNRGKLPLESRKWGLAKADSPMIDDIDN